MARQHKYRCDKLHKIQLNFYCSTFAIRCESMRAPKQTEQATKQRKWRNGAADNCVCANQMKRSRAQKGKKKTKNNGVAVLYANEYNWHNRHTTINQQRRIGDEFRLHISPTIISPIVHDFRPQISDQNFDFRKEEKCLNLNWCALCPVQAQNYRFCCDQSDDDNGDWWSRSDDTHTHVRTQPIDIFVLPMPRVFSDKLIKWLFAKTAAPSLCKHKSVR